MDEPILKVRRDRFEVLQGSSYVAIDRPRIEAVHYHDDTLRVHYRSGGEVVIDCRSIEVSELKKLVAVVQQQRDQNQRNRRRAASDCGFFPFGTG